jgi:hypothetical protein
MNDEKREREEIADNGQVTETEREREWDERTFFYLNENLI